MFEGECNQEVIERIKEMETILDKANSLIENEHEKIKSYLSEIDRLKAYYESQAWKDDFALDEAGKLPADLKRGVLSEDGIYDMLERLDELMGESKVFEMDYDAAASVWIEKDKASVHMDEVDLKVKIEEFIKAHNTCALATACADMVRNTPIEYNYADGCFYFFSEGGLKFKCLKENKNVGIAIFEPYGGFGQLKSLQVEGTAEMIEPFSDEYLKIMEHKKIPVEAMKKLPQPMNLIKVVPESYDYLDSDLKKDGFGSRQHVDL